MRMERIWKLLGVSLALAIALVLSAQSPAYGAVVETYIEHIYEAEEPGEKAYVLLTAYGRVLRLNPDDLQIASELKLAMDSRTPLQIEFSDQGDHDVIHGVLELAEPNDPYAPNPGEFGYADEGLDPNDLAEDDRLSLLDIPDEAAPSATPSWLFSYFRGKNLRRNSQCFHRAYLWAYDAWTEHRISTQKVFLFFTRKYIRGYNYRWWFHVSPYTLSSGQEQVLDATFTGGPRTMQNWTNVFMRNDAQCPTISRYYGHESHNRDGWCYLRKTSMYYYHPNTVERADRGGYQETQFERRGLYHSERGARPRN